jgi:hypothetical protein
MDRTASAAQAAHAGRDELLIARMFGGDVDEIERARALDLMAGCAECAAIFADFGAIAEATAAMRGPSRPRDFRLTEEQTAGLRRKRRGWPAILWPGLRRSFGGSLAALGLAGAILTGALSVWGGMAGSPSANTLSAQRAAGALSAGAPDTGSSYSGTAGDGALSNGTTPAPGSAGPVVAPLASNPISVSGGANGGPTVAPSATPAPDKQFSVSSPGDVAGIDVEGQGTTSTASAADASPGGIDARLVWLGGFGALFAIGLAIVLWPRRPRGRGRRARS